FQDDAESIRSYQELLSKVLVKKGDQLLLPELYLVPGDRIEDEKALPGSQIRVPNDNLPLVWAQSLYILSQLILDGLLIKSDIDPIARHKTKVLQDPVVQIVVLAQDEALVAELGAHGVQAQTPEEVKPVNVRLPYEIIAAYRQIGRNDKLGLTGRPVRRLKTLGSSRIYRMQRKKIICLSLFFMLREFYLAYDMSFLIDRFKSELHHIHRHWKSLGRPTVTVLVTRELLEFGQEEFYAFMQVLNTGMVENVPVKLGQVHELLPTASYERVDNLHGFTIDESPLIQHLVHTQFLKDQGEHRPLSNTEELEIEVESDRDRLLEMLSQSSNLYEQIEVLANLVNTYGQDEVVSVGKEEVPIHLLLQEVYDRAGGLREWAVVRQVAALLDKIDIELQNAVSTILVRQKTIQVGKAYSDESHIVRPVAFSDLISKINTFCRDDIRDRMMTQEMLVYIGLLIKSHPELFEDLKTIRVSYIILLLIGALAREKDLPQEEAFEQLMHLAPSDIQKRLREALQQYSKQGALVDRLESIQVHGTEHTLTWELKLPYQVDQKPGEEWLLWRQSSGTLSGLPDDFYTMIWRLFEHTKGLIVGDKLERRNRLESTLILADMTEGEKAFANRIDHLLNKVDAPEYRQLTIEAMAAVAQISEQNPDLLIEDYVVFDVLIGHAVRLAFLEEHQDMEDTYQDRKSEAWTYFYNLAPSQTTTYLVRAFEHLLAFDQTVVAD
ncbi:MAG: glycoside hydrolase family 15 protein, partial [Saprospiraceae bacterium]|nr:glycoside hydrolase family 15 protein [Saprospiraceae bacterium]